MTRHSRRDALKLFGAGAAAFSCAPCLRANVESISISEKDRYFPLSRVRLGAGPFLDAQRLDEAYLLKLEPDRMLHNFRVNAGLAPRAPVYGGWESVEPWIEIRCHGHTLGHYLTAVSCMYESTGDMRFAERVDYIVAELAECQAKTGGWLTAFPDGVVPLTDSLAGKPFPGVPWYTTHKVLAGLRDAYKHRGSKPALDALVRFTQWIHDACRNVSDETMQAMLDREHGGMNEVLADASVLTRNEELMRLAERFSHRALLDPLSGRVDTLDGLHANTQIPKVVGFARIAEYTASPRYSIASDYFWQTVTATRSYVTGGHGDGEHFFPRNEFKKRLESGKTMETCCTHNMLRLTRVLHARNSFSKYIDYFERALFNGILASQDPATGMMTYFQSTRPGYVRLYHTPFDSFWCCTGSGLENHARYGEAIYARNEDENELVVNLFIASTLDWRERGITVKQETRFPDADSTRLTFTLQRPQSFVLSIRDPDWCKGLRLWVNGREVRSKQSLGYRQISRRFKSGDVVDIRMPMTLRTEPLPNAPEQVALVYGPIVLAGRFGTDGLTPGSQLIVNERESGNMLQADVKVPRWTKPLPELVANTARTSAERLEFRITGFEGITAIDLLPWFRLTHERYNLYWTVQNSSSLAP